MVNDRGFLGSQESRDYIYMMLYVTLNSKESEVVSRCSLAVDVGGFAEPCKILVSILCGMLIDRKFHAYACSCVTLVNVSGLSLGPRKRRLYICNL